MSNFDVSGVDFSANAPALPANLLVTIPANKSRRGYFIQNQDGTNSIVVQFLNNAGAGTGTELILAPGASAGSQGGSITMSGIPHTGVIKIYSAATTTKVGARAW